MSGYALRSRRITDARRGLRGASDASDASMEIIIRCAAQTSFVRDAPPGEETAEK